MAKTYDATTFTKAKDAIFNRLVANIGTLSTLSGWTSEAGKNAFNGHLPPCFDVWGITFGGGGRVEQTWNGTPWELHVNSDIEGIFREQPTADELGMKLLALLGDGMRWINDAGAQVTQSDPHRVQAFRLRSGPRRCLGR